MLLNGISFSHQNIVFIFNFRINTTFQKNNHSNFIEKGLYPWHVQRLNIKSFFFHFLGLETCTSSTTIVLGFSEGSNISRIA